MTPGYRAFLEGAAYLDLSQRGKLSVRGPDRARLIHAMTTNDVRSLTAGTGCYGFFLNSQGRVLADANVFCLPESILLDTEPETRSSILTHLEEFTIADDASSTDVSPELGTISVEGPEAKRVLGRLIPELPAEPYQILWSSCGWVARISMSGQPGWTVFTPASSQRQFLLDLESAGAVRASPTDARIVRIENRIPRFGEEITSRFLAPETGQMHAISTHKGCYLGQEVVERVCSRNAVSRLLTPIHFDGGSLALPGTKLREEDVRAGEIVSAVYSPRYGRCVGFAYIRTDLVHPGAILSFDSGRATIAGPDRASHSTTRW